MEIPQGNTIENSGKQNLQIGFKSPRALNRAKKAQTCNPVRRFEPFMFSVRYR
jgi:hypothetical protein